MATKKCTHCKTEIDSQATVCPNCKKDQVTPLHSLIALVILIGIFYWGYSALIAPASRLLDQAEPKQKVVTKTVKLNTDIQVDEVKWKVTKARFATQLTDYSGVVKPAGKFLIVNVIVENTGKDMKTVTGLKVVDDKGREFTSYSKTFGVKDLGADSLYILSNINPNVPLTFADVYEIPADAKGLKLEVGDLSLLGGSVGLVDLGL